MTTNIKIFASPENIEEEARAQIETIGKNPAFEDARIRVMPDVHAGAGCVIGFTAIGKAGRVIPNVVGVDIGCGMYAVGIGRTQPDLDMLDSVIRARVPAGFDVHEARPGREREKIDELLDGITRAEKLKSRERLENSVGTLGGGNHFIELDADGEGGYVLVIHSGSRGLGKQVADIWQKQAVDDTGSKARKRRKISETVATLKAAGRSAEIESAIREIKLRASAAGGNLSYLSEAHSAEYLRDMEACVAYAKINREEIARVICDGMGWEPEFVFHTIHNYIEILDGGTIVTRKGAISAKEGERVLIPLNMRDGCVLGTGKGNADWNYSAPHGAGRKYGSRESMRKFTEDEYRLSMRGIYSTSVSETTLDECPMAYKDPSSILERLDETVCIDTIIKPAYNFKAS